MSSDLHLAETISAALQIRDTMRGDGVPEAECAAALERTIRASWPFTREWHVLCARCEDTGLEMRQCSGDAMCGRRNLHPPHAYGTACWCEKGKPFRPKQAGSDDELVGVAKTKKPSRFGR